MQHAPDTSQEGSFGMRGADEAGCHRGDGSLVFYWCLSLLESGPGLCGFTQSLSGLSSLSDLVSSVVFGPKIFWSVQSVSLRSDETWS